MNGKEFEDEINDVETDELLIAAEMLEAEQALADAEAESETSLVPSYTKEDFLTGIAPFEWVYQSKDNKLKYAQYLELMKAKAKEVGISNFMALWKAYLATVQTVSVTSSFDNVTAFTGQSMQLNCGAWEADDFGVYGRNMFGGEIEACNHPIMPVCRLKNIETDTEKLVLAFCKRGESWRTVTVDRKTVASTNGIITLADYGIAVNSSNAQNLIKYLAEVENLNLDKLPIQKSVSRLGFFGRHDFSPYSDNLVFDASEDYREMYNSVCPAGDFEEWRKAINEVRESNVIARIYIAASFASVLVGFFNGLPFFVHLWGGTGAGKTVALMAAASVWANPHLGEYVHTFKGTDVGNELTAAFVNNLPLGIDELQIVSDRKQFDELIYTLCEGVGKKRGNANGGLRKLGKWRNCILTTGEFPITSGSSGGGAVNRVIEVDCKGKKLIDNPAQFLEVINNNYGHAGKMFVEQLLTNEGAEMARKVHSLIFDNLSRDKESTDKQIASAALIVVADLLANEWIFKSKTVLRIEDIKPFLATKEQVSANVRALKYIYDQVGVHISKFKYDSSYIGEIWGTLDEVKGLIYIIKSQFDKMLEDKGYNSTAFLSWAKENKVVVCDHNKRTKKHRIKGAPVNCVCLRESMEDGLPF